MGLRPRGFNRVTAHSSLQPPREASSSAALAVTPLPSPPSGAEHTSLAQAVVLLSVCPQSPPRATSPYPQTASWPTPGLPACKPSTGSACLLHLELQLLLSRLDTSPALQPPHLDLSEGTLEQCHLIVGP